MQRRASAFPRLWFDPGEVDPFFTELVGDQYRLFLTFEEIFDEAWDPRLAVLRPSAVEVPGEPGASKTSAKRIDQFVFREVPTPPPGGGDVRIPISSPAAATVQGSGSAESPMVIDDEYDIDESITKVEGEDEMLAEISLLSATETDEPSVPVAYKVQE